MDTSSGGSKRKNAKENLYVKRQRRHQRQQQSASIINGSVKVPSLFNICVDYLVSNFDYVEALGIGIDTSIRRSISQRLVERGLMNGAAFDVLAEDGIEALELVDCAEVTQSQLSSTLQNLLPSGLKSLSLLHAGRCFGPQAVQSVLQYSTPFNSLFALSIGGAYLLRDADAAKLIQCMHGTLSSIEFQACPLLGKELCEAIGECYASSYTPSSTGSMPGHSREGCLLEVKLEDLNLEKDSLLSIVKGSNGTTSAKNDALRNLRNLSLKRIDCLDDDALSIIFPAIGGNLESIDLSDNRNITDVTLSYIRRCNVERALSSLTLSGCRSLTAIGLEALFTMNIEGISAPPPCLKRLDLSKCGIQVVTDEVIEMAALASWTQKSSAGAASDSYERRRTDTTMDQGGGGKGGLVHLNIAGGSVTDATMEKLAVSCASSLKELNLSFCASVSDKGLGYLVSKVGRQFRKITVWGCAQITEEFVDGHDRVDEIGGVGSSLEIEGVWMKKAGNRSIR
uniref:Uncharacterized protein n=1 Tax=Ditylum brightwellii TaxID=49249 RepID=A0A7S4R8S3_9STRA